MSTVTDFPDPDQEAHDLLMIEFGYHPRSKISVVDHRDFTKDVELPSPDEIRRMLVDGGLTGTEQDVLTEYLTQSPAEWDAEIIRENCTHYLLAEEMAEEGMCSLEEAQKAEKGYAAELVIRVEGIFQNHRS